MLRDVFICEIFKNCILRKFKSENWFSIQKYNNSIDTDGDYLCGGVLITEIFGVSTGHTMLKDSFDIILQSRAGEHDITKNEGHEQL